eukprot:2368219-Prymnesium_polylepis.2
MPPNMGTIAAIHRSSAPPSCLCRVLSSFSYFCEYGCRWARKAPELPGSLVPAYLLTVPLQVLRSLQSGWCDGCCGACYRPVQQMIAA